MCQPKERSFLGVWRLQSIKLKGCMIDANFLDWVLLNIHFFNFSLR